MMADRIGQQLGNYRLIRLLGQGGFADVYLGEHVYLKIQAAIKVLQMRLANDDMEDFLNEARTIASLKHSHIVRVLDFGIDSNTPFLVMDYAPMGTLRQRYPRGTRLSPATIVPYVKQVATALQYAHDKKLIHRDIKPENMLLESDNDIMLSDFGIATIAQSSRYQSTQEAVGTLAYMAPEQLQGKPRIASDQYSLGIVVYEWLTGDRPFHGSFVEMASQHMLVPPPPLREKISDILPPIEEVVMVALAKDPQQRFMSVQAFANAFEQACQPNQSYPIVPKSQSLQSTVAVNPLSELLPLTVAVNPPSELLEPTVLTPSPHSPLPPTVKVSPPATISQCGDYSMVT
jgi:serine/threonine protein kinase